MNSEQLRANGYTLVKGIIKPDIVSGLYDLMGQLERDGQGLADSMIPGCTYFYKYPVFESIMENLRTTIEPICGCRLYKTYSYARQYRLGDILPAHRDREACEFTVSILIGFEGTSWPLWVQDHTGTPLSFSLEAGDALIFKGIELCHWRDKNIYGTCSQLFLHYVDQDGPYEQYKDDGE